MTHEQIIEGLLKESKEDCLSLPWIIGYAACDTGVYEEDTDENFMAPLPITNPVEVKAKTLSLVRDLLNTKKLQAGYLAGGGVRVDPWRFSVETIIERIDREWTVLGKQPDVDNDICWLGECLPERWPHGG